MTPQIKDSYTKLNESWRFFLISLSDKSLTKKSKGKMLQFIAASIEVTSKISHWSHAVFITFT